MPVRGNLDKWIESGIIDTKNLNLERIPFKETNMYIRKVLRDKKIYEKILNKYF